MTGSNDNSSLGLYKAVEKTDENGNNYFAYEEMFTGQSLEMCIRDRSCCAQLYHRLSETLGH